MVAFETGVRLIYVAICHDFIIHGRDLRVLALNKYQARIVCM